MGCAITDLCEAPSSLTHSPEDDDVFEEGEEDEDDARAHPDVQRRDVAHPRRALPAKTTIEVQTEQPCLEDSARRNPSVRDNKRDRGRVAERESNKCQSL